MKEKIFLYDNGCPYSEKEKMEKALDRQVLRVLKNKPSLIINDGIIVLISLFLTVLALVLTGPVTVTIL